MTGHGAQSGGLLRQLVLVLLRLLLLHGSSGRGRRLGFRWLAEAGRRRGRQHAVQRHEVPWCHLNSRRAREGPAGWMKSSLQMAAAVGWTPPLPALPQYQGQTRGPTLLLRFRDEPPLPRPCPNRDKLRSRHASLPFALRNTRS